MVTALSHTKFHPYSAGRAAEIHQLSYPQHIHSLGTPEFEALTTTCCAPIHRPAVTLCGKCDVKQAGPRRRYSVTSGKVIHLRVSSSVQPGTV
jgi:hypothetical protein